MVKDRFEPAERLKKLPPYLFAEIDKRKKAAIAAGKDVINLGIGDPDIPTPEHVVEALAEAARDSTTHQYALDNGLPELRYEFARWFKERFEEELDPDREVYPLIGSKEGIAHLPLAFVDPGDLVLVPEPGYPVYRAATIFAGGIPYSMELLAQNNFLPRLHEIHPQVPEMARMIFLNYPNNPTAALATKEFYADAVRFAEAHDIIIAQDCAYSEIYFGEAPLSILQTPGARQGAIEFHSLSKTYNMTGWRIGFAVGSERLVSALGKVKTNIDSGVFSAIQRAGIAALRTPRSWIEEMCRIYKRRRDVLCDGLAKLGWNVKRPEASFYVWIPVPPGYSSAQLCVTLLERTSIVMTPGIGFGPGGEGYIRAALTVPEERMEEAVDRIGALRL